MQCQACSPASNGHDMLLSMSVSQSSMAANLVYVRPSAVQTQMPVFEGVEEDGDDMMAEAQRALQQQLEGFNLAYEKAQAELQDSIRKQDQ